MSSNQRTPTIRSQLATCALLAVLAAVIALLFHPAPFLGAAGGGLPLWQQAALAVAFAAVAALAAAVTLSVPRLRNAFPIPSSLQSIDLSGFKPLQIGLAAGVGEELLFRAALQPLLGLWWAAAVFALAHVRTAALAGTLQGKVVYVAHVFAAGVALGLVYEYAGLLAAILIHATIDVASLVSLQKLKGQALVSPAN